MRPDFEPEVIFPSDGYQAAIIFLAVIAYPERGAGQVGRPGSKFANALADYCVWSARQSRGLKWLREQRNNPNYVAPRKRQFEGILEHGLKRISRRSAAYSVYGTRLLRGFSGVLAEGQRALNNGRPEEAFHKSADGSFGPAKQVLWEKAMPSARQVIASNQSAWSDRLSLNKTGEPADPNQKAKDLYDRAYCSSVPVLHMVHSLSVIVPDVSKNINGWDQREPFSALLMNFDKWIWQAIDLAEGWRNIGVSQLHSFSPTDHIRLTVEN